MEKWITSTALILVVFLVFMNEVDFSAGRRRRSRSSRRRNSSRRRDSGDGDKGDEESAYKGTHGYTDSTWLTAFRANEVYGGRRYLQSSRYRNNPDIMPTICSNTYAVDENGTVFNLFACPRHNESDDHNYCCGEKDREYCCQFSDSQTNAIVVAVVICGIVVFFGIVAFVTYKKVKKMKKEEEGKEEGKEEGERKKGLSLLWSLFKMTA